MPGEGARGVVSGWAPCKGLCPDGALLQVSDWPGSCPHSVSALKKLLLTVKTGRVSPQVL